MTSERTLASIRLQGEPERNGMFTQYPCGCEHRIDRRHQWRLCQYHNGFDDAAEQADELQALIDAYAEASTEDDQYDYLRYMRAIGDLRDAATKKEGDRG